MNKKANKRIQIKKLESETSEARLLNKDETTKSNYIALGMGSKSLWRQKLKKPFTAKDGEVFEITMDSSKKYASAKKLGWFKRIIYAIKHIKYEI